MDYITVVIGFISGIVTSVLYYIRFVSSRVTIDEAKTIYTKVNDIVVEYNKAKQDGTITLEEQLRIAEESMEAVQEIVKSLKD